MIHPTAIINQPVKMGEGIEIREFALIGGTPMLFGNFKRIEAPFGVEMGNKVYIGPHATIMAGFKAPTKLGDEVLVGQYTNIGHDCIIGNKVELVGMSLLSGYVEVGDETTIHAGTTVRNRIKIGRGVIIGQSSNVVKDIPDNVMAYGNPCKVQRNLSGLDYIAYRAKKKVERMLC
jgi:acyl-[acyl carrier protein]--UDP-N-acetylglucosamine O-acyltransferase